MPRHTTNAESDRRLALYRDGLSDIALARTVGVTANSIAKWRKTRGLPPTHKPGGAANGVALSQDEEARRHLYYQLGYTDLRLAKECGINRTNVKRWRMRRGLPINNPTRKNQRHCRVTTLETVFARIRRAVGRALPRDIADDAVADLCRDVLDGTIPLTDIETMARKYGNRVLDKFASRYGPRSLDEELGDDDGFRMIDLIRDDRSSSWLEEMGATVW